jgi:hypothetical protein
VTEGEAQTLAQVARQLCRFREQRVMSSKSFRSRRAGHARFESAGPRRDLPPSAIELARGSFGVDVDADECGSGAAESQSEPCPAADEKCIRRDPLRTGGQGWSEFNGGSSNATDRKVAPEDEYALGQSSGLEGAKPLIAMENGYYEDRRININGGFTGGSMYYPFTVRQVSSSPDASDSGRGSGSQKVSRYVTRVVRSDGAILCISEDPAPPGTPHEDRVLTLDDGTEISRVPEPDMFCTWKLASIQDFCRRIANGRAPSRAIGDIIRDVEGYLRTVTWLPNEKNYALLAAYVAMSYVYNAFEAIPMILINGDKGSGKSTTARALAGLSFNGHVMGAGSEAALIRFADQGRGLLVLDDLEQVGRRSKNPNGVGDINEMLKVSYDKSTAIKPVVHGGRIRKLEFFGPKILTNISGIDPVNATRTSSPLLSRAVEHAGVERS